MISIACLKTSHLDRARWLALPVFATLALAGCLDEGATEDTNAQASSVLRKPQFCNVVATATPAGKPVLPAEISAPTCFDSFSDSIYAATQGKVRLPPDATPASLDALPTEQRTAAATYVIAVEYIAPRWDAFWGSWTYTTTVGSCDMGWQFSVSNFAGSSFQDSISSTRTYEGCAHGYHYDNANFGGARLDCGPPSRNAGHDPCYYDLGALTDRTSSAIWTNSAL